MSKEQELDLAKVIREKIEFTGNNNAKKTVRWYKMGILL